MNVIKEPKKITIDLTDEEDRAVDYFMRKTGGNSLNEFFGFFFESRIGTMKSEISLQLYQASTQEEKDIILKRIP